MSENEHSKQFWKIKEFYDKGLWSETRVTNVYIRGLITEEEYNEILRKDNID